MTLYRRFQYQSDVFDCLFLTYYLIARSFHKTFATVAACQQRTLTPLDTWSGHTWGLGRRVNRFILCQNYMMSPLGLPAPSYFEDVYCFNCGRRSVAVAQYRMICLVLPNVLMSIPLSPELVLSSDFWVSNTPRYFRFALNWAKSSYILFLEGSIVPCYHQ